MPDCSPRRRPTVLVSGVVEIALGGALSSCRSTGPGRRAARGVLRRDLPRQHLAVVGHRRASASTPTRRAVRLFFQPVLVLVRSGAEAGSVGGPRSAAPRSSRPKRSTSTSEAPAHLPARRPCRRRSGSCSPPPSSSRSGSDSSPPSSPPTPAASTSASPPPPSWSPPSPSSASSPAPAGGALIQRLGEQTVYLTGLLVVAASSLATAFAQSYVQLLVLRGLGGIGSTMFTRPRDGAARAPRTTGHPPPRPIDFLQRVPHRRHGRPGARGCPRRLRPPGAFPRLRRRAGRRGGARPRGWAAPACGRRARRPPAPPMRLGEALAHRTYVAALGPASPTAGATSGSGWPSCPSSRWRCATTPGSPASRSPWPRPGRRPRCRSAAGSPTRSGDGRSWSPVWRSPPSGSGCSG